MSRGLDQDQFRASDLEASFMLAINTCIKAEAVRIKGVFRNRPSAFFYFELNHSRHRALRALVTLLEPLLRLTPYLSTSFLAFSLSQVL